MISFQAKYHLPATYLQRDLKKKKFIEKPASFIEFEPANEKDTFALIETAKIWQRNNNGKSTFASDIARDAYCDFVGQVYRYFGLTSQMENFKNLDPKKILAVMEVAPRSEKLQEIVLLQADPTKNYHSEERMFKHVGKSIFTSLCKMFPKSDIILEPIENARPFYRNIGMKDLLLSRMMKYYA